MRAVRLRKFHPEEDGDEGKRYLFVARRGESPLARLFGSRAFLFWVGFPFLTSPIHFVVSGLRQIEEH